MARILVVCPSHRDHRELARFAEADRHEFVFHDYASSELEELLSPSPSDRTIRDVDNEVEAIIAEHGGTIDAVASTDDYPGSTLASIVAKRLNLPGTSPKANLLCQHKYHARERQRLASLEGTPAFERIESASQLSLPLPCFVKPVKSYFSIGAGRILHQGEVRHSVRRATLPECFFTPFRTLFEAHAGLPFGEGRVLAEDLLEGHQATLEGYVFDGRMEALGVVDSIMFPGTHIFSRFEYPSSMPDGVLARMADVTRLALQAVGFDHGLFNIEFIYDSRRDRVHIVEINPRMASQFADLYEKVDGINTYEILVDLALGRPPRTRRGKGMHGLAVSHVMRRFEDAHVLDVTSPEAVEAIALRHPDARIEILVTPGRRLSHELQDGKSFRYGMINLGACDRRQAMELLADCDGRLRFSFSNVET